MQTYNEYIWAVFHGPMTTEKILWFSKATLSKRAWLFKGKVSNPVTCWLVWMHSNDIAHPIRYKFMFVCTSRIWVAFWRKPNVHISILPGAQAEASWSFVCSTHTSLPMFQLTDKYKQEFSFHWHNTTYRFTLNIFSDSQHTEPLASAVYLSSLCPILN